MYYLKQKHFAELGARFITVKESKNLDELKEYAARRPWFCRSYVGIFDENGNEIVNIRNGQQTGGK